MTDALRVADLPTTTHDVPSWAQEALYRELRVPGSSAVLRDVQARALYELHEVGGLLGAMRVGSGKTLVSLLAPTVLQARRPILLLPAALIGKTEAERRRYAEDWRVSREIKLVSYESLGRVSSAGLLEAWRPDLIVADECHFLKNSRAAVTRRVARYFGAHPDTLFVPMSGTIVKRSIRDYAHLAAWALGEGSPLPIDRDEVEAWARVLDEEDLFAKEDPLRALCRPGETPRTAFRRRLLETPGVIVAGGDRGCDASLQLRGVEIEANPQTDDHFRRLHETWETPTGEALADAKQVWKVARELALGLHYRWDPSAPSDWLDARREWAAFVRETISRSRTYDSELQVAQRCAEGALSERGRALWAAWTRIKPTFKPNPVPVWHDDHAVRAACEWLQREEGICWVSHQFFADALVREGHSYFGQGGLDKDGRRIEEAKGPIVASIRACGTGRNLQAYSVGLVTSAPSGADAWEQLLGRTHREGQAADVVRYDVLLGCGENLGSLVKAREGARMIEATTGQRQKLISECDWIVPEVDRPGPRWAGMGLALSEDAD